MRQEHHRQVQKYSVTFVRSNYTRPQLKTCGYCGENLAEPHVLGAHLPGCRRDAAAMAATLVP